MGAALRALPAHERARIAPGNVHRLTRSLYTASADSLVRRIGNVGVQPRAARLLAGYDETQALSEHQVMSILADARRAVELLDRHGYRP